MLRPQLGNFQMSDFDPDLRQLEAALRQARAVLRPGGRLLGILPAMDAVHYYTMLLVDRALRVHRPGPACGKCARGRLRSMAPTSISTCNRAHHEP